MPAALLRLALAAQHSKATIEGARVVSTYMRARPRAQRGEDAPESGGSPALRLMLAIGLLVGMLVVAVLVWRRTRSRGQRYEELETIQLTDDAESRTPRPSEAPPPREPLPEGTAPGSFEEQVAAAAAERPPAVPSPAIAYGPLELRPHKVASDTGCWHALHPSTFEVRGASYLRDGKSVPSDQGSSLLAIQLFRANEPVHHVAARADAPTASLASRAAEHPIRSALVVNLVFPSSTDGVYQLVFYFGIWSGDEESGHAALLRRFCAGSDAFRNARLKIVPRVVDGSWLVKQGVGSRPAILGKTLKQRFYRGEAEGLREGYFEVSVDCNSSPAAGRVVSLVKSYAKSIVVDLAFIVEAQTADELPERVIGCGRLAHVELSESLIPSIDEIG